MMVDSTPAFCVMETVEGPIVSNSCLLRINSRPERKIMGLMLVIEGVRISFAGEQEDASKDSFAVLAAQLGDNSFNFQGRRIGYCHIVRPTTMKCSVSMNGKLLSISSE